MDIMILKAESMLVKVWVCCLHKVCVSFKAGYLASWAIAPVKLYVNSNECEYNYECEYEYEYRHECEHEHDYGKVP